MATPSFRIAGTAAVVPAVTETPETVLLMDGAFAELKAKYTSAPSATIVRYRKKYPL
jgi:hypothetical protein